MTDIVERLRRSPDQYAGTSPNAVASGSKAQMMYFVEDAQKDIAALINTITALRARVGELEGHVAAVRSVEAGRDVENIQLAIEGRLMMRTFYRVAVTFWCSFCKQTSVADPNEDGTYTCPLCGK